MSKISNNEKNKKNNGNEDTNGNNPFQRRSLINRSPTSQTENSRAERVLDGTGEATVNSELMGGAPQGGMVEKQATICKLGEQIRSLVDMLEENGGRRRSIHQPMRDAIKSIKLLYELYAMESHDVRAKVAIRKNASSQTSPWLRPAGSRKRKVRMKGSWNQLKQEG